MELSSLMASYSEMSCDGSPIRSPCYTAPGVRAMPRFQQQSDHPRQSAPANTGEPQFLEQIDARQAARPSSTSLVYVGRGRSGLQRPFPRGVFHHGLANVPPGRVIAARVIPVGAPRMILDQLHIGDECLDSPLAENGQ